MKTLFICIDPEEGAFFFEKEGDYSFLNGTRTDDGTDGSNVLLNILYGYNIEAGNMVVQKLKEPTKNWDKFVRVENIY